MPRNGTNVEETVNKDDLHVSSGGEEEIWTTTPPMPGTGSVTWMEYDQITE